MREGWTYMKIGDFCDVKTGKLDANASDVNGVYPFFTCSKEPLRINSFSYDAECVLIAGNGDLNVKYYKGKFDAYQRTYILTIKKGITDISVHYLYLFFLLYVDVLRKNSIGGVIKYIKLGDITDAKIHIPSISEQERIVSELDLLTSIIEKQKAQLKELDTLAQSIFYDMFGDPIDNPKGWEVKRIKDIAEVKIGPFGSALHQQDYIMGGTPLVNPIHIIGGKIIADKNLTISEIKRNELASYLLSTNDVVFGRRGDIGRCALVTRDEDGYLCGTGSLFIRFKERINPLFSIKVLSADSIKQYLIDNAKGATMLNLNSSIVEKIPIVLPPLSIQQSFADKIEAIEQQKELIKQSIKETEKLFNSRMDYYFN